MSTVTVEPLTGTLGAIVHGVDLREPLSAELAATVRSAAVTHRVIFLRDGQLAGEVAGGDATQRVVVVADADFSS